MVAPWKLCMSFSQLTLKYFTTRIACQRGLYTSACGIQNHHFQQSRSTTCNSIVVQQNRNYAFFNTVPADELWKGVVGVSNAGKKKGRGKRVGRKKITDLNRGQALGSGPANILWPGLNAPIIKGREVLKRTQLPPDPQRSQEIIKMRDLQSRIRYTSNPPLLRGWSGSRFPGQSIGPPDPVADYTFEDFDTRVLEFRLVTNMTGTLGRKMSFTAFVVTGNKQGIAGFGLGKAQTGKAAIRMAKNRAAQRLMFIPMYENHTVYHNMFAHYHHSRIFVHKKEKGYGLRCHRVLKTCSELIGLKDLHCKCEGNTKNAKSITRAFFDALATQETHQQLADRMGYNVVELRKERDNLPVVIASPSNQIVNSEDLKDDGEDLEVDFDRLYYGGKCEYVRPPRKHFYSEQESWKKKCAEVHSVRNQFKAQMLRRAGLW